MGDERRKLERKFLVVYSRVFDRKTGKVIGYLSDLTVKGAMVIGEHHLEHGRSLPASHRPAGIQSSLTRTIWISMPNRCGPNRISTRCSSIQALNLVK